ncbi:hypothetical protein GG344DRAFT_84297 [Lentinula edodes]|nr:hypothetical protein GG344DRAFT_84297 [Lentinula edodes]
MSTTTVFNPVLMKTGQQSNNTNSNYHAFSTKPRMQPSRMAGPEEHTSFSTPSQYIRHSDINSLLPLQEINIRSSVSFQGCKAFYYLRANVDDTTPGPRGLEFELPIDTVQGPDLHKIASRIIQYGSDGYVRMHDAPLKSNVVVTLHGWDWEKKDHSLKGFKIHDGFDFVSAANERILWDGYDGNIGLGPRQGDIQTEKSRSFLASLTATRQILDASMFIIRFVHPDDLDNAPLNCNLFNVISFGPGFPFQAPVNPDAYFSSPIPTISGDIADMDRNDYSWIDMDNPEKRSSVIQGIDILMDTATPMTVLPDYVVSKIQSDENWLGSSRQTRLDLSMNDKTYTRLARKKIQFEFKGEGHHPVGVTVSAKSFMVWYSKVEAGDNPKLHLCSIKGSYDQKEFVLGQNWYWAAIVKHVSPREKQKFPFVQVMPNGYFTDYDTNKTVRPTDMILKPLPPRLYPTI